MKFSKYLILSLILSGAVTAASAVTYNYQSSKFIFTTEEITPPIGGTTSDVTGGFSSSPCGGNCIVVTGAPKVTTGHISTTVGSVAGVCYGTFNIALKSDGTATGKITPTNLTGNFTLKSGLQTCSYSKGHFTVKDKGEDVYNVHVTFEK